MNADDDGATALADEGMCGWPNDPYFADLDGVGDDLTPFGWQNPQAGDNR